MTTGTVEDVDLDFDNFDWSVLDRKTEYQEQPYFRRKRVARSLFNAKSVRTIKAYRQQGNEQRTSTAVGQEVLEKFKRDVLDTLISPIIPRFTSLFEGISAPPPDRYEQLEAQSNVNYDDDKQAKSRKYSCIKSEMNRKARQPGAINRLLFYNEPQRSREGPACRCSDEKFAQGIHHSKYQGETAIAPCILDSNNLNRLHHYFIKVTCQSATLVLPSTTINFANEEYIFEGFSIFLHEPYSERFINGTLNELFDGWSYEIVNESPPTHFTIAELEAFHDYAFGHLLELYDLDRFPTGCNMSNSCAVYHAYPRFTLTKKNEKRILAMSDVLSELRYMFRPFKSSFMNNSSGMLFVNPRKRPRTIRVDGIFTDPLSSSVTFSHRTIFPSVFLQSRDPAIMECIRSAGRSRAARSVAINIPAEGFYQTGFYSDLTMHCLHLISAIATIRFRQSLCHFEKTVLGFKFKNPIIMELAFMHPSFRAAFGTNASHCRTTMSNCGYFDVTTKGKKVTRRRGFETLMGAMSVLLADRPEDREIVFDNERLEFLGDAVIGFTTTARLFLMYPHADEGFLTTCRSSIVRNESLAHMAYVMGLHNYLLFGHHADPWNQMDVDHSLANAFEALMGAIFLDAGPNVVDRLYAVAFANDDEEIWKTWSQPPSYILKRDFPVGDRHLTKQIPYLQQLTKLEEAMGIYFRHIRILARAFTKRSIGDNFLTVGDNQTLEFLGDSVLQLATTVQLYNMFPFHNEGNLSLLRSCLVSNHTQSLICEDLGLEQFVISPIGLESQILTVSDQQKDKADLLEAFIGALYLDQGLECASAFIDVCYMTRLKSFIIFQTWNDPKSLLQQCCLYLRTESKEAIYVPEYRTLNQSGPTNEREYEVGVFVNGNRLAVGGGKGVRQAQMQAAANAILKNSHLFPVSFMAKSMYQLNHTGSSKRTANEADEGEPSAKIARTERVDMECE